MLFDLPLVPGLSLSDEVISRGDEAGLLQCISRLDLAPFQFQGWEGKRLTTSFGSSYDYQRGRLLEAPPIPHWLLPVRDAAARAFERKPDRFVQALVIRYDPGVGIGWHRDRPQFDEVIGLSLVSAAELAFRRRRSDGRFDRLKIRLEPRSAYLLSGEVRKDWEHGIARHGDLRFALTFRSLAR